MEEVEHEYASYHCCTNDLHMGIDDPYEFAPPKTKAPFDRILNYIYQHQAFPADYVKMRTAQYAQHIWEAVEKGYGSGLTIGDEYKADLNKNIWQFAAAKTNNELNEIVRKLKDKSNKMLTEADFKNAAAKVAARHDSLLKVEKSTAFRSGQMAYKWKDVQATKDLFPFVEFDAVLDNRTTDLCKSLDKIIVPVGHVYLELYWPPNHHYCRLNVRKLSSGTPTPNDKLPYPVIPDNFKQNLAMQGQALPMSGGYFKDVNPEVYAPENIGWVSPLYKEAYQLGERGLLRIHERTDSNKKEAHLRLSRLLAGKNHTVDLTPEIHHSNKQARRLFYPELKGSNANPDLRLNGKLADYKIPDANIISFRTLKNAIHSANTKEASVVIIDLTNKQYTMRNVLYGIKGRLQYDNQYTLIQEVWLIDKDKVLQFSRDKFSNTGFYKMIETY